MSEILFQFTAINCNHTENNLPMQRYSFRKEALEYTETVKIISSANSILAFTVNMSLFHFLLANAPLQPLQRDWRKGLITLLHTTAFLSVENDSNVAAIDSTTSLQRGSL
jgi:hypothetical protein